MQMRFFPNKNPIIPYDTIMSAFVAYQRLKQIKPDFERVLEIGPGSSGMSYFFSVHKNLEKHSYTDVCCQDAVCEAYPWWKISDIAQQSNYYDIVLSNANLQEFSNECLHNYLILARQVLKDDGILFAQCLGLASNNTPETLFTMVRELGFEIAFYFSYNSIFYMDYGILLEPFEGEDVVLAPANESVKYLLRDKNFVDKFNQIYLYDDFKQGSILGYPIVNYEGMRKLSIQNVIFTDDNTGLRNVFVSKFNDFNFIDIKGHRLIVPILCLIKNTHPDFKYYEGREIDYYKMESKYGDINNLFLKGMYNDKISKDFVKKEVLDKLGEIGVLLNEYLN